MLKYRLIKNEFKQRKFIIMIFVVIFAILGFLYGKYSIPEVEKPIYKSEIDILILQNSEQTSSINAISSFLINEKVEKNLKKDHQINVGVNENIFVQSVDSDIFKIIVLESNQQKAEQIINSILEYGISNVNENLTNLECRVIKNSRKSEKVSVVEKGLDIIAQNNLQGIDRYTVTPYKENKVNNALPIKMAISSALLGMIIVFAIIMMLYEKQYSIKEPSKMRGLYDFEILSVIGNNQEFYLNEILKQKITNATSILVFGKDNTKIISSMEKILNKEYANERIEVINKKFNSDEKNILICDNVEDATLIPIIMKSENIIGIFDFNKMSKRKIDGINGIVRQLGKDISGIVLYNVPKNIIKSSEVYQYRVYDAQ